MPNSVGKFFSHSSLIMIFPWECACDHVQGRSSCAHKSEVMFTMQGVCRQIVIISTKYNHLTAHFCLFSYFRTISHISAVVRKWIIIFPAKYLTFPLFGQSAQTNASSAIYCAYNNTEAVSHSRAAGALLLGGSQLWVQTTAALTQTNTAETRLHVGRGCFASCPHASSTNSVLLPPFSALCCCKYMTDISSSKTK